MAGELAACSSGAMTEFTSADDAVVVAVDLLVGVAAIPLGNACDYDYGCMAVYSNHEGYFIVVEASVEAVCDAVVWYEAAVSVASYWAGLSVTGDVVSAVVASVYY